MASVSFLFFMLMMLFVHVGKSSNSPFKLKCKPAVGVIGQTTNITCFFESQNTPVSNAFILTRTGQKNISFSFRPFEKIVTGDTRFEVDKPPSLQLYNTAISDEGEYDYKVRTDLGLEAAKFTINVTAKYSDPIITTVPEDIVNDKPADLYCKASGGYPAGTIHWFDQSNSNWTKSAELKITVGNDGLLNLTSKLSFQKIDSLWAPFTCVVLSHKYEEIGRTVLPSEIKDEDRANNSAAVGSTVRNSIAGVVVIGSLVAGLLVALLFKRRRDKRPFQKEQTEEERDLNEPVYKKAADSEEKFEV